MLSACRQVVERAFGILVRKWGILRQPLQCSLGCVPLLVSALVKLNNFCLINGDDGDWAEDESRYGGAQHVPVCEDGSTVRSFVNVEQAEPLKGGSTKRREALANRLFENF